MNDGFLASLNKLIGDEAARVAAQKAETDRLTEEGRKKAERIAALDPQIKAKLGEVSKTWSGCLDAVQVKSQELGFSADISGWQDEVTGWHNLQVNFHRHSTGIVQPLRLTVTQQGEAEFNPERGPSFDLLQIGQELFVTVLLVHVTTLFHQIRDGR